MSTSSYPLTGSSVADAFALAKSSDVLDEIPLSAETLFFATLLDSMRDGAIFVDREGLIQVWSQTVEVMTGMSRSKVTGIKLSPRLLNLVDSNDQEVLDESCPLKECLRTGKKKMGQYKITGRSGRESKVEMTFAPVKQMDGSIQGAVILVHDSSIQLDLKRQLRDLYEFSMLDPLTQVSNRAEFERVLEEYVQAHRSSNFECSIIICDIDYFKSINDNYNHHIGDQALVSFAGLLQKFVRSNDVVARYGGEEFVILCADCDGASAVQRAEEIRVTLTKTPQQMLDGKCITASFGVSELQKGDSATDFFVRADTALLKAKELGRNQVVESAAGNNGQDSVLKSAEATSLSGVAWRHLKNQKLICEEYQTSTPLAVLVEKLRGYILEMDAEIQRVEPDFATMAIQVEDKTHTRKADFIVDIEFQEREATADNSIYVGNRKKTFIRITIGEGKKKWFAVNANDLAPLAMNEIRRYLTLHDEASKLSVDAAATDSGR